MPFAPGGGYRVTAAHTYQAAGDYVLGIIADDFDGNYVLFGNRPVPGLFDRMLASEIWSLAAMDGCLVCGGHVPADDKAADDLLNAAAVGEVE